MGLLPFWMAFLASARRCWHWCYRGGLHACASLSATGRLSPGCLCLCSALQTEIEDGFDVQHTFNLNDTLTRYSDLTRAITLRYSEAWDAFAVASATGANADLFGGQERCMTYAEFLHVCRHINADTAGDLLGHMLLQVIHLELRDRFAVQTGFAVHA